MATLYNPDLPPVKGVAWAFDISLVSKADTTLFKTTPTLAAGDVQVSQDGAQYANLATFPPAERDYAGGADSGTLRVVLTIAEMTASTVTVRFHDQTSPVEWCDAEVTIYPQVAVTTVSSQDVRDAMKLAPTAGAPAAGSVDDHLDDLPLLTDFATADEIADAVWTRTPRTLTQSGASVASTVAGSTITVKRGDSLSAALTSLGNITGYTNIWFTVKEKVADLDTAAIILIDKTTGLLFLNGAAAAVPGNGSITVDDAAAGDITIALQEAETDDLAPDSGLYYDVQVLLAGAVTTLTEGACNISGDVTRRIV